ncbi:MAG: hypothetical protein GEU75_11740 [Dehalococcoidia bacterium]|nr:hypothetical protein [Dehalococcoidia bacterium]
MINPLTEREIRQALEVVDQNKGALPIAFLKAARELESEVAAARSTGEANDSVLNFLETSKEVRGNVGLAPGSLIIKEVESLFLNQPNVLNPSVS